MNILFICTGNTCRSPMAEALLKSKSTQYQVKSAGLFANTFDTANPKTLAVLKEKDIDFQHQSQPVTVDLLQWSDLVLTMTSSHKDHLQLQFAPYGDKVYTLKQYINQFLNEIENNNERNVDVLDPFGGRIEDYRRTCEELNNLIDQLIDKDKQQEQQEE